MSGHQFQETFDGCKSLVNTYNCIEPVVRTFWIYIVHLHGCIRVTYSNEFGMTFFQSHLVTFWADLYGGTDPQWNLLIPGLRRCSD